MKTGFYFKCKKCNLILESESITFSVTPVATTPIEEVITHVAKNAKPCPQCNTSSGWYFYRKQAI